MSKVVPITTDTGDQPAPFIRNNNRRGLDFTLFSDIEQEPRKSQQILNFQGEGDMVCSFGPPSAGKSTLLIDKEAHVANGMDWFGRRVTRCAVLHVAAERAAVVKRRLAAWRLHHEVDDLPLAVLGGQVDLRINNNDAQLIIDACRRLEDLKAFSVGLVTIETVNRVLAGGDENNSKDMGALIDRIAFIQQHTRATVELVHHVPQDVERMRGHGSLLGAMDVTQLVKGTGTGVRTCTIEKANDGPEGECIRFEFMSIELSRDEYGTPTTAPVVIPSSTIEAPTSARGPKLMPNQQSMFNVLESFGTAGATVEEWNAAAKDYGLKPARRGDFGDWRHALMKRRLIHTYAGRWYVTKGDHQ